MTIEIKVGFMESIYGEIDIFFDKDNNILGINNTNDADWRHEYFNGIFGKVGVAISQIDLLTFEAGILESKLEEYFGF
jgi:hypothetical protein